MTTLHTTWYKSFIMKLKKHELAKITELHPRRLLDWQQRGYLVPVEPGKGQGQISYFDEFSCLEALVLAKLSELGISLSKLSGAIWGFGRWGTVNPLKGNFEKQNYRFVIYGQCEKIGIYMTEKKVTDVVFAKTEEAKLIKANKYDMVVTINLNPLMLKIKENFPL